MSDDRMKTQSDEFDALANLVITWRTQPAIVDDGYPEWRHGFENDLDAFFHAALKNGRFEPNARFGLRLRQAYETAGHPEIDPLGAYSTEALLEELKTRHMFVQPEIASDAELMDAVLHRCDIGAYIFANVAEAHRTRYGRWHNTPGTEFTALETAGAIGGEMGETAEVFLAFVIAVGKMQNTAKKIRRAELGLVGNKIGEDMDTLRLQLAKELADVFHYSIILSNDLKLDLWAAIRETFNAKSEQLGFPERL